MVAGLVYPLTRFPPNITVHGKCIPGRLGGATADIFTAPQNMTVRRAHMFSQGVCETYGLTNVQTLSVAPDTLDLPFTPELTFTSWDESVDFKGVPAALNDRGSEREREVKNVS